MDSISMKSATMEVKMKTGPDLCDITAGLAQLVHESRIEEGMLSATIIGSTGALTQQVLEWP